MTTAAAETNGKVDELEEEALDWDSGLAKFIQSLESDLLKWHGEERVKAKERQMKGTRALKDVKSAEQQTNDAAAMKLVNISDSEPWQDRLEAVVSKATLQREEMRQMLEMLRLHANTHLETAGGPDFVEGLPETGEGKPLGIQSEEVTKLFSRFLDIAEKVGGPAPDHSGRRRRRERSTGQGGHPGEEAGGGGGASLKPAKDVAKDHRGDRKMGEKKPMRKPRGPRGPRPQEQEGSFESEYDDSRSRTPRGRCARGPPGRPPRPPAQDFESEYEYSYEESRSPSPKGRGRGGGGPPRDDRRPPRGPPRGDGGPRRGGRGPERRGDRPPYSGDIRKDIDKFVHINRLDVKVEKTLRDLSPPTARRVMGLSGGSHTFELSGDIRDPTAVVMARIRRAKDGPPPREDRGDRGDRGGRGGGGGGGGGYAGDGRGPPRRGQRRPRSDSRSFSPRGDRGPPPHRRGPPPGRGRRDDGYGRGPPPRRGGGRHEPEDGVNQMPLGKVREFPEKPSSNGA